MANTPFLSRSCYMRKNGVKIAKVTSASLSWSRGTIDLTALGDDYKSYDTGFEDYTISGSLLMLDSNTEHEALYSAMKNSTKLTDIDLYFDSTTVYTCDTVSDSAACMILTQFDLEMSVGDNAVTRSFTLKGSGPLYKTSD